MRNKHKIENNTAIIEVVSKGVTHEVLIDSEDLERIDRTISLFSNGYARFKLNYESVSLHRFIVNAPEDKELVVDHINGNKLDNRKENLRIVSRGDNRRNTNKVGSKSGFKGVYKQPSGRYRASIQIDNQYKSLGVYDTPEEAFEAYMKERRAQK